MHGRCNYLELSLERCVFPSAATAGYFRFMNFMALQTRRACVYESLCKVASKSKRHLESCVSFHPGVSFDL